MNNTTHTGKVKYWSDSKGFGFIEYDGKDVFVHYTEIKGDGFKTLSEDMEVDFDLFEGPKGLTAKNVYKRL